MTNFIFKSTKIDLQKIGQSLEILLNEQKHQRCDLQEIKFALHKLLNNEDLKKTVDEFYSRDEAIDRSQQDLD